MDANRPPGGTVSAGTDLRAATRTPQARTTAGHVPGGGGGAGGGGGGGCGGGHTPGGAPKNPVAPPPGAG
ncbi:hypothetical protein Q6A38_21955, partial [Xanthomonas euvesicatoria pv. eucalypti]|uniref:hypothetical protein n=1 Tax=Xanthomonas euvesicatoria TaxID=456327 RepID=UPI0026E2D753